MTDEAQQPSIQLSRPTQEISDVNDEKEKEKEKEEEEEKTQIIYDKEEDLEKSQIVENEEAKPKTTWYKIEIPKVKHLSGIIVLMIIWIIGRLIVLPTQISYPQAKRKSISSTQFSEERAMTYLDYLTKTIGVRNKTKARELAGEYIFEQFLSIKNNSMYGERITVGVNNASGIQKNNRLLTVNNVYFFVNFTQQIKSDYILISSHYDTQPYTVGCNDDTLAVAAVIELASIYASFGTNKIAKNKYNYNILFAAIDAEEKGLFVGSRAIIWANSRPEAVNPFFTPPRIVYNIESTGKGRHLMYRANSEWLIEEYLKCTPDPFAHSLPSALLEMVGIPLATDASIYAHHAHTLGLANLQDHWVYHTPLDNCDQNYVVGSLQLLGDNVYPCLEHFLQMSVNEIPDSGYGYDNRYSPRMPNSLNGKNWKNISIAYIPKYEPNGVALPNDLLFYTVLNKSYFVQDISTVSAYQCICAVLFVLISLQILYHHNRGIRTQTEVEEIIDGRRFIAKAFGLTVANYLANILMCVFFTFLIKSLRKSQGENIACLQHAEGMKCNTTHFRGLAGLYISTMILLVGLITYSFQFAIAKINEKYKKVVLSWRSMELIVFLINNIFFSFAVLFLTLIGQITAFPLGGKKYSFEMVIHFSYLTFWWSFNLIVCNIIIWTLYYAKRPGFIHPKINDCFLTIISFAKAHISTVTNIFYIVMYLGPLILSSEFFFTFIPILIGFENWVKIEIVAVLAALVISTLIMPFSSLLQRFILKIYKFILVVFIPIFVLLFILCCALPGKNMDTVYH